MSSVVLLATGFGSFPGAPFNPTAWLMDDLRDWSPAGASLVTHTLGVHYDVWDDELAPLIAATKPDAIVAFGLSAKANGFKIETTARNVIAPGRPDARDTFPTTRSVNPLGPETYATTLRFELEHPHVVSDDAGDYICNLTLYRLLENGHRATFVHVAPMPEAKLREGARAILDAAARATSFLLYPAR